MTKHSLKRLLAAAVLSSVVSVANATIVQIQTSYGNIEVNLFDQSTPKTVENFLTYVSDSAYDDTIVHRSISGFITQSGGYYFDSQDRLLEVAEKPSPINEPEYSNLRGTIAMAKLGGNPNSATSQWFINLADNSANLDAQNGGFTVFGQVTEAGMQVIDTIAALNKKNLGGAFTDIPWPGSSSSSTISRNNTVVVDTIVVTDTAIDSAIDLMPTKNTASVFTGSNTDSGGGSLGIPLTLMFLGGLGLARRREK